MIDYGYSTVTEKIAGITKPTIKAQTPLPGDKIDYDIMEGHVRVDLTAKTMTVTPAGRSPATGNCTPSPDK